MLRTKSITFAHCMKPFCFPQACKRRRLMRNKDREYLVTIINSLAFACSYMKYLNHSIN